MPPLHLVADRAGHVAHGEGAGLLGDAAMEHDLQQQVTKFVLQIGDVLARDRVGDLIGFLNRVWRDGGPALRAIPLAAMHRVAQAGHDADQAGDFGQGGGPAVSHTQAR
jgi:hypothetical protein